MYKKFDDLLMDLGRKRPNQKTPTGTVFFFNDHEVRLVAGEMEQVHWMDIQIELPRFKLESIQAAKKVLQANREMGMARLFPLGSV
jgi:hypothetical protein